MRRQSSVKSIDLKKVTDYKTILTLKTPKNKKAISSDRSRSLSSPRSCRWGASCNRKILEINLINTCRNSGQQQTKKKLFEKTQNNRFTERSPLKQCQSQRTLKSFNIHKKQKEPQQLSKNGENKSQQLIKDWDSIIEMKKNYLYSQIYTIDKKFMVLEIKNDIKNKAFPKIAVYPSNPNKQLFPESKKLIKIGIKQNRVSGLHKPANRSSKHKI